MLKDLIANAALLMTSLYLAGEIIRNKRLNRIYKRYKRLLSGLIAGLLGCLLMVYSVSVPSNVIIDLRQFALIVIAIQGGIFPTLCAGLMMSAFRILYFGFHDTSYHAAIMILVISMLCGLIARLKLSENKKWFFMNISSLAVFNIFIITTLRDSRLILNTVIYYTLISIVTAFLVAYLAKHITLSNSLYLKYKSEAMKDFLTGLDNVRRFELKLNHAINHSRVSGKALHILMLDIDYFKRINDTYGHSIGDEVLRELAELFGKLCKNNFSISRVGGEEFCAIIQDLPVSSVREFAERIRKAVEKSRFTSRQLRITISIGIASFPETVKVIDQIMEEADKALYKSKSYGRNRVSFNTLTL